MYGIMIMLPPTHMSVARTVMRNCSKIKLPFIHSSGHISGRIGRIVNRRPSRTLEFGDLPRGVVIFFGDPSYAHFLRATDMWLGGSSN